MSRKFCVIVDAYNCGALLAPEFKTRGFACVHVQSSRQVPEVYSLTFNPEDFEENVIFSGDIDQTVHALKAFEPQCVVAGIESGVILADQLSERLRLKTNGTTKSWHRRNKGQMAETVRSAGLVVPQYIGATNVDDILQWRRQNGFDTIVVKPPHSAGTDNVIACESEDAIRQAFDKIYLKINTLGLENSEVIAQEFLEGDEYVVNTVSCNGRHYVTVVFRYGKIAIGTNAFIYEYDEWLPREGKEQDALVGYTLKALDALGIKNGPAHSEIMLTKDGPRLVEVAARMDGITIQELDRRSLGRGQVEFTVDAYTDEASFSRYAENEYVLSCAVRTLHLISPRDQCMISRSCLKKIEALPSFFNERIKLAVGEPLKKTTTLFTSPGEINLAHDDEAVLLKDYHRIREFEASELYE